jgi:hypothetical protein
MAKNAWPGKNVLELVSEPWNYFPRQEILGFWLSATTFLMHAGTIRCAILLTGISGLE